MKKVIMKIILLTILILVETKAEAQVTGPPYFDTCRYLQPLQGEWMSVNGNDTIRIYLRYHRNFSSDPETYNSTLDQLWGWVDYKQGNSIMVSDYANRFAPLPYNLNDLTPGLRSIILSPGKGGHRVVPVSYVGCISPIIDLGGSMRDLGRCSTDKYVMATVNPQGTQMSWYIEQPTALLDSAWCGGLTLPQHFTLIKQ